MPATLLDFSQNVDLRLTGEVVSSIDVVVVKRLGADYFIVGALARDLWLVYQLGVPVARQTDDADFAVAVSSWEDFHALRNALLDSGDFRERGRAQHRLRHRNGIPIDIVPFGGIEKPDTRSIAWPPDNAFVMSVFGFREAANATIEVRFPGDVVGRVVTLPALAVLKLDAWSDRHVREPEKDAYDFRLIIRSYADANNGDRLFDGNPYLLGSPADYECAGAWLLGKDMAKLLDARGQERVAAVIAEQADRDGELRLAGEMMRDNEERALQLLSALEDGFTEEE
jgi:predicted nucleotidyltransferase